MSSTTWTGDHAHVLLLIQSHLREVGLLRSARLLGEEAGVVHNAVDDLPGLVGRVMRGELVVE